MEVIQKSTLVLKTCDLGTPGHSDQTGSVNDDRTSMTWNLIKMRTILGDMFDKYDLFNLKLNSISMSNHDLQYVSTTDQFAYLFGDDPEDRSVIIEIKGLGFVNNTYDSGEGWNTDKASLCTYTFDFARPQVSYGNDAILTFEKGTGVNNITISYSKIHTDTPPTTQIGNYFPNMVFHFSIYGVPREHKHDHNKHR